VNQNPQALTLRYITNLLIKGKNDEFELITLEHQQSLHDDIVVGSYYNVIVRRPMPDHSSEVASGVTPHQAIHRALVKFGVTFR
jgi:hypothetical protein